MSEISENLFTTKKEAIKCAQLEAYSYKYEKHAVLKVHKMHGADTYNVLSYESAAWAANQYGDTIICTCVYDPDKDKVITDMRA